MIESKQLKRMYEIKLTTKVGNGMVLYSYSSSLPDGLHQLRHSLIGVGAALASTDWLTYSRERPALDEAETELAEHWKAAVAAEQSAA